MKKEKDTINNTELRSEKVRQLIDGISSPIVIWGIVAIIVIIVILICLFIFMPYPYEEGKSVIQYIIS